MKYISENGMSEKRNWGPKASNTRVTLVVMWKRLNSHHEGVSYYSIRTTEW